MVTPLAQELRERLDWALPESEPGSSKDEGTPPVWAEQDEQPGDSATGPAERPGRSLPGVRAPIRTLRVVSGEPSGSAPPPARPAPPPSPAPRRRTSESGLREASELKAEPPVPALRPPAAAAVRPSPAEKAAPARAAGEDPIDAASTSDWAAVVTSAPALSPRANAPEPEPEPASAAPAPSPEPAAPAATPAAPPREKTSPALIAVASLMAVGLLGVALGGESVLGPARRLPQRLLGAPQAAAPVPAPVASSAAPLQAPAAAAGAPLVRGMVMAAATAPVTAPACVRDSSQTISSGERDQLLLDAVRAFERGKQERAQELLQRYVQEACDSATLEALGLLNAQLNMQANTQPNRQLAPAGKGGSR
ncbi:MAG: hypothetical protein U1A78_35130 [Polyangia bacterium]